MSSGLGRSAPGPVAEWRKSVAQGPTGDVGVSSDRCRPRVSLVVSDLTLLISVVVVVEDSGHGRSILSFHSAFKGGFLVAVSINSYG